MVLTAICLMVSAADGEILVSDRPVQAMSVRELKAEYKLMDEARPGLGLPITLVAVGAGLIAYGGIFALSFGTSTRGGLFGTGFGYLIVAMLSVGAALVVPGIWLWWRRAEERKAPGQRMDEITERLNEMERGAAPERDDAAPPPRPRDVETYQL